VVVEHGQASAGVEGVADEVGARSGSLAR
jgi:hypothetical protein